MAPLLSVITPMHNATRTIGSAYRSLCALKTLDGSLLDWEWLVTDDRSSDDGPEIVRGFAAQDQRVHLGTVAGRGVSAARNTGLDRARGEWLLFLDADDWLLPHGPARLIRAGAPTGAAFGASKLVTVDGDATGWSNRAGVTWCGLDTLLDSNRFQPCSMVIRRTRLGALRFNDMPVEDYDLWLRAAHDGTVWAGIADDVAAYRLSPAGQSRKFDETSRGHRDLLAAAFARGRSNAAARRGSLASIDFSAEREHRLVSMRVFECATSTAACSNDPDAVDQAEALFDRVAPWRDTPGLDAAFAGWSAFWHVPHGSCRSPLVWNEADDDWLRTIAFRLDEWWRRAFARGWIRCSGTPRGNREHPDVRDDSSDAAVLIARDALAALMAGPNAIARSIIDRVPDTGPVVLLGLGQNAGEIGPRFDDRFPGRPLFGRDARWPDGGEALVGGKAVTVLDDAAPWDRDAVYLMTPADDERFVARVPEDIRMQRWSRVACEVASIPRQRLERVWPRARATPRM